MEWYRRFLQKNGVVGLLMTVYAVMYVVMILFLGIFSESINELMSRLTLSMEVKTFVQEPWTLLMYWAITPPMYIWLLIVDLTLLYTFGNILNAMVGDKRTQGILFFGILINGLFTIVFVNLLPTVDPGPDNQLFGLHALNASLIAASMVLVPRYEIQLIRWKIPLLYVGAVILFIMMVGYQLFWTTMGISMIVGALVGFTWVKVLQTGTDLTSWLQFNIGLRENNGPGAAESNRRQTRIKVLQSKPVIPEKKRRPVPTDQERLDFLLDKINEVGFDKLSKKEKEDLDRLSSN